MDAREQQTRSWAAPLPDFTKMPLAAPSMRLEWETRDTHNNRLWENLQESGAKAVTSHMLASHPSAGAERNMPTAGRLDRRGYSSGPHYFPDVSLQKQQQTMFQSYPRLPPQSLFQNAWTSEMDIEGRDSRNVAREMRGVVKETNEFHTESANSYLTQRIFTHQWIPPAVTQQIVETQLTTAEQLRPRQDDYRQNFLAPSPQILR